MHWHENNPFANIHARIGVLMGGIEVMREHMYKLCVCARAWGEGGKRYLGSCFLSSLRLLRIRKELYLISLEGEHDGFRILN